MVVGVVNDAFLMRFLSRLCKNTPLTVFTLLVSYPDEFCESRQLRLASLVLEVFLSKLSQEKEVFLLDTR